MTIHQLATLAMIIETLKNEAMAMIIEVLADQSYSREVTAAVMKPWRALVTNIKETQQRDMIAFNSTRREERLRNQR